MPSQADLEDYYRSVYGVRRIWSKSVEYLVLMERRAAAQRKFIGAELAEVRSALDIGCGVGALVEELSQHGIDAVGYDSDATVVRVGRERWGAKLHEGHITGQSSTQLFDLLCLSHVVEHLASPVEDLRELATRVRPGGLLFIEVPHCVSWLFSEGIETESHLGFYSERGLRVLAERAGLEMVRLRSCGPAIEDYHRSKRAKCAVPKMTSQLKRLLAGVSARVGWVRTEFDGWFESYDSSNGKPRLWLRALLRARE